MIEMLERQIGRDARRAGRGDGLAAAHDPRGADRVAQARLLDRTHAREGRIRLPDRRNDVGGGSLIMSRSVKNAQPAPPPAESIAQEITRIGAMNIGELRPAVAEAFGSEPPPAFSKDLLARAIAYRAAGGGLWRPQAATARLLRVIGETRRGAAPAGEGRLRHRPRAQGRAA